MYHKNSLLFAAHSFRKKYLFKFSLVGWSRGVGKKCIQLILTKKIGEKWNFWWAGEVVIHHRHHLPATTEWTDPRSRPFAYFFSGVRPPLFWPWEWSNYPSQSCNGPNGLKGLKFKENKQNGPWRWTQKPGEHGKMNTSCSLRSIVSNALTEQKNYRFLAYLTYWRETPSFQIPERCVWTAPRNVGACPPVPEKYENWSHLDHWKKEKRKAVNKKSWQREKLIVHIFARSSSLQTILIFDNIWCIILKSMIL